MPETPRGIVYPGSSDHTRLWEHHQALADSVEAALDTLEAKLGDRRGASGVTTDAAGRANVPHSLGIIPTVGFAAVTNNSTRVAIFALSPSTSTTVQFIIRNLSDGSGVANASDIELSYVVYP
jgi:hypothetical protein